eukprot:6194377-Pleurochrysis_carterae.AAC.1
MHGCKHVTPCCPRRGEGSTLTYELATYSLNGSYIGLTPLTTQLQLCTGRAADPTAFLDFAHGLEVRCELRLETLLSTAEPLFYDIYLRVGPPALNQLYPVPVRVANLRSGGAEVNQDSGSRASRDNDQLVRRFFSIDSASGIAFGDSSPSSSSSSTSNRLPVVVRYISSATLTVTLQPGTTDLVLPPLLEIEYAEVGVSPPSAAYVAPTIDPEGATARSSFLAVYTMTVDDLSYKVSIGFVVCLVLWIVGWVLLLYLRLRRNQRQAVDLPFLIAAVRALVALAERRCR